MDVANIFIMSRSAQIIPNLKMVVPFLDFKTLTGFVFNSQKCDDTFVNYSYSKPSQDIKPKRELRREAPQLSFGFWLCLNIDVYRYKNKVLRIEF